MININDLDFNGFFDVQLALENLPFILSGIPAMLIVTMVSMVLGMIIGLFLALWRRSKLIILRWPARIYISFMRGTPMLVFLFILYFGLPMMGIKLSAITAACIGFGLNSAAYIAEINRGALNSIDHGQWESAKALNMTYWQTMWKIIIPQAIRIAVPSLTSVFMDVLKATSLAAVITVPELFQKTQIVAGREYDAMTMYVLVALIYWAFCIVIGFLQGYLEERYSRYVSLD